MEKNQEAINTWCEQYIAQYIEYITNTSHLKIKCLHINKTFIIYLLPFFSF
jgi:hypothetical protein